MVCEISTFSGIADFLVWPTACDYYFWMKILITIFIVLVWTLYLIEKKIKPDVDIWGCLGVSSIATIFLAGIGTLIKNSSDIAMIQTDILIYILAFCIPIILIWIFKE